VALGSLTSGKLLVIYTDHVDAVANVPRAAKNTVSMVKIWRSGKGEYKIFLWKK
jgi:TusA-related sulfurtransferase